MLALLCLTASAAAMPQQEASDQDETEQATESETEPKEDEEDSERPTKSGYDMANRASGPTSVRSDLQANDEWKYPLLTILGGTMQPFYRFKERVNGTWGIAFAVDYNFLNQYASFSFTDDQATSCF